MISSNERLPPRRVSDRRTPRLDQLSVRLFGGLLLSRGGIELPAFPTRKSSALFCDLVLHRSEWIPRDVLCERLWGDQPDKVARKLFRTELWRVRSVLEPDDCSACLRVDSHRVGLLSDDRMVVDVWRFLDVAKPVSAAPDEGRLSDDDLLTITQTTALYRGHLLEGESLIDDWTRVEVERLRLLQVMLLERLMSHHSACANWRSAVSIGGDIHRLDPCREHVHREMMGCFVAMGDRPSAVRQFRKCTELLKRDLDLPPMRETVELYDRIRAGNVGSRTRPLDRRHAQLGMNW